MGSSDESLTRWSRAFEARGHVEVVAAYDSMTARLAAQTGFDGVVIGGGATANFIYGLPDIGILSLPEMLDNTRRIAASVPIPVIADIDDGGATTAHIHRTVQMAESFGAGGVMLEDIDSSAPKHLWSEAKDDWDLSEVALYPLDIAVHRLKVALKARSNPAFVVIARTDALDSDPENGLALALERASAYAAAGADMVFIRGLKRDALDRDMATGMAAPLLHAEVDAVDKAAKEQIFATGASLFHGLLPITAAYSAYKETLIHLRDGTIPKPALDSQSINRQLLETVDLKGWSRRLRDE